MPHAEGVQIISIVPTMGDNLQGGICVPVSNVLMAFCKTLLLDKFLGLKIGGRVFSTRVRKFSIFMAGVRGAFIVRVNTVFPKAVVLLFKDYSIEWPTLAILIKLL